MSDRVMGYFDMCQREQISLQRGMNFQVRGGHSVILMSLRPNAPYRDRLLEDGTVLLYEGHDAPRIVGQGDPKLTDQPALTLHGRLTENGKFFAAARAAALGEQPPERVQVYQKLRDGASGLTMVCFISWTLGRNRTDSAWSSSSNWRPLRKPLAARPHRQHNLNGAG